MAISYCFGMATRSPTAQVARALHDFAHTSGLLSAPVTAESLPTDGAVTAAGTWLRVVASRGHNHDVLVQRELHRRPELGGTGRGDRDVASGRAAADKAAVVTGATAVVASAAPSTTTAIRLIRAVSTGCRPADS
jgi:hypothetical protein